MNASLEKVIEQYSKGVFCPAELWAQVLLRVSGKVHESLNTLPLTSQEQLRESYRERPWSLDQHRDAFSLEELKSWLGQIK